MKVTWTKCSNCKKTLNFKAEGGAGTVQDFGQKTFINCPRCNTLLSDGLKEWPELNPLKKSLAIFRALFTAFRYGLILTVFIGIGFLLSADNEVSTKVLFNYALLIFLISSSILGVLYLYWTIKEVNISTDRYWNAKK